jgi:hypothetical protein
MATRLHDVTTQETIIFNVTAIRMSRRTYGTLLFSEFHHRNHVVLRKCVLMETRLYIEQNRKWRHTKKAITRAVCYTLKITPVATFTKIENAPTTRGYPHPSSRHVRAKQNMSHNNLPLGFKHLIILLNVKSLLPPSRFLYGQQSWPLQCVGSSSKSKVATQSRYK